MIDTSELAQLWVRLLRAHHHVKGSSNAHNTAIKLAREVSAPHLGECGLPDCRNVLGTSILRSLNHELGLPDDNAYDVGANALGVARLASERVEAVIEEAIAFSIAEYTDELQREVAVLEACVNEDT